MVIDPLRCSTPGLTLLEDAGRIPVVSVQDFRRLILPVIQLGPDERILDDSTIELIRERCEADGLMETTSGKTRWKRFPTNPAQVKATEDKVFLSFQGLWNDVIGCVQKLYPGDPLVQIAYRPNNSLESERPVSTRPDCVVELIETTTVSPPISPENSKWFWENSTTAMEFK